MSAVNSLDDVMTELLAERGDLVRWSPELEQLAEWGVDVYDLRMCIIAELVRRRIAGPGGRTAGLPRTARLLITERSLAPPSGERERRLHAAFALVSTDEQPFAGEARKALERLAKGADAPLWREVVVWLARLVYVTLQHAAGTRADESGDLHAAEQRGARQLPSAVLERLRSTELADDGAAAGRALLLTLFV